MGVRCGTRKVCNASVDCIVPSLLGVRKLLEAVKRLLGRSEVKSMQTNSIMDRRKVRGKIPVEVFLENSMIKYWLL